MKKQIPNLSKFLLSYAVKKLFALFTII